ncbi:MAG: methionine--tRNA ligase subunit beta, partial [Sinobacteraceae bacterium]|nr:methionine--tRNA ligase subunit beta [Nevskiaceae bacterium]
PEWLRYYIAAKLNANVEDLDFNPDDFLARVNSDLIGKYVNIASRAASFITRHFNGELRYRGDTALLGREAHALAQTVGEHYEARELGRAMREIMGLADRINHDFDAHQPWILAKDPANREELQDVCSRALQGFRLLSVLLAPVLPALAARVARELFGLQRDFLWSDADTLPQSVSPYKHLMTRVEPKQLDALFDTGKENSVNTSDSAKAAGQTGSAARQTTAAAGTASPPATITIEDFQRLDLRIARIVTAEYVPGSDKLLKLTLDLGAETRTVFSGIKAAYDPATLQGRLTLMVANLAPRKMKFGLSEGMVLCAGDDGSGLYLLTPDQGAAPGMRVT